MRNPYRWNRPASRTYAYNLDLGDHYYSHIRDHVDSTTEKSERGVTPGAMTYAERLQYRGLQGRRAEAEDVSRKFAGSSSSEAVFPEARGGRATTAPPANAGYKGYYTRQLEASRAVAAQENAKKASASAEMKSAASAKASAASSSTTAKKTVTINETTTTSTSRKDELKALQKSSMEYGRTSGSAAVRRAESQAVASCKDVGVAYDLTDDICKKVADIHMAPYAKDEVSSAAKASQASWSKVSKMEADLAALTQSAMAYKSVYLKSASQMAAEAMSEDASAVASSYKKTKKTVVESSSRKA